MWLQQNDESIAADLEEDTFILDSARALLNDLFLSALKRHEVIATTLTKKIDTLIGEQKEHVARVLKEAATELYLDAQKKVAALYVEDLSVEGIHPLSDVKDRVITPPPGLEEDIGHVDEAQAIEAL